MSWGKLSTENYILMILNVWQLPEFNQMSTRKGKTRTLLFVKLSFVKLKWLVCKFHEVKGDICLSLPWIPLAYTLTGNEWTLSKYEWTEWMKECRCIGEILLALNICSKMNYQTTHLWSQLIHLRSNGSQSAILLRVPIQSQHST